MTLEILLSSISEQEKNAYLQKTISALSDEERNLLQTYFEANMSLLGTSQKLFLHKNTVQYKLNHIYQKCRLNPRVFKDRNSLKDNSHDVSYTADRICAIL